MAITVMQRVEMKYLLTAAQTEFLREHLDGYMAADNYGKTTIASLYYDTPNFRLIRTSVEKPLFKEKMRLRAYGLADASSPVFLEMKRKAYDVVYKRRVQTTIPQAERFFSGGEDLGEGQIDREMTAFRDYYKTLVPTCLILYDRTAYFAPDGDLRLTIDECPRYRTDRLTLTDSLDGTPFFEDGQTIVEIKLEGAMPLWLARILSAGKIKKSSFSKYGEAYSRCLVGAKAV